MGKEITINNSPSVFLPLEIKPINLSLSLSPPSPSLSTKETRNRHVAPTETGRAALQAALMVARRTPRGGLAQAKKEQQEAHQERYGRRSRRAQGLHRTRFPIPLPREGSEAIRYVARFGSLLRR